MYSPRATTSRPRRLVAGLAATAVVSAGLACMGAAHAAGPAFPQTLPFSPVDLEATADGVFASGYVAVDTDQDYVWDEVTGYVQAVGTSERVSLGEGTLPSAMSASPDGGTLFIIGTQKQGEGDASYDSPAQWTVDTETMTVDGPNLVEGRNLYAVAAGDGATYTAYTGWSGGVGVSGFAEDVALPQEIQPLHLAVLPGAGGTDEVVVGATDFQGEQALGTLRTITSDGTVSDRRVLGPDDDRRGSIVGMDVDEENHLTYAVSVRDTEDGQAYGLNVIGPNTDEYLPLPNPVSGVSVSPDGETVYLASNSIEAYDADRLDAYADGESPSTGYLGGDGFVGLMDLAPSGRIYATMEHETSEDPEVSQTVTKVHAVDAPGAPTDLRAVASDWSASTLVTSWAAPANTGGTVDYDLRYELTLQDNAGGDPVVTTTFQPDYEFDGLTEGHTYTLSVVTTNGLFSSAPATATYTVAPSVGHPSAITIRGRLAVGSTLSLANTGSWASGAALTYAWYTDNDQVVSTAPTLRLTKAHLGRNIFAEVRGTKAGVAPATVYSNYSGKVGLGTLTARVPSITGKAKVGKVLTAKATGWTSGTRLSYQWLANGQVIKGAKAKTLKLKGAQAGKKITVKVTGTQAGYRAASKTSKATAKVMR
jgi:hypothetical protein